MRHRTQTSSPNFVNGLNSTTSSTRSSTNHNVSLVSSEKYSIYRLLSDVAGAGTIEGCVTYDYSIFYEDVSLLIYNLQTTVYMIYAFKMPFAVLVSTIRRAPRRLHHRPRLVVPHPCPRRAC